MSDPARSRPRWTRSRVIWACAAVLIALAILFAVTQRSSPANGGAMVVTMYSDADSPTLVNRSAPRETGVRFTSSQPGTVNAIRFYKGRATKAGDHRVILWSAGGKILAKVAFSADAASGWQTISLPTPVPIEANVNYVASYYSPAGNYAENPGGLTQGRQTGPLTALGGAYRDARGFPRTSSTTNYWVDVVFTYEASGAPSAPPSSTTITAPSTPTATATRTPTPASAPTRTATSDPMPSTSTGSASCTPSTTGQGGFPLPNLVGYANDCNTGPRYRCTTTRDTVVTSHDGQLIEGVCINGGIEIRHNNVVVRDVLVMGSGPYAFDIGQDTPRCPANLRVEYTEVNMTNADNTDWGIYQRCAGGHTFDHLKLIYAGRGMMTYGSLRINQSYIYSNRTNPGAHRTAFSTHGGSDFTIIGSTFICVNTGCSSALNIYSDYAPASNVLIQGNILAGGSICLRGGETHEYADQTHDIRVLNNRFSTRYAPECGTLQAFAQFDESAPGNVRSGNVWHESGLPLPDG